jgi:hypothetical protein
VTRHGATCARERVNGYYALIYVNRSTRVRKSLATNFGMFMRENLRISALFLRWRIEQARASWAEAIDDAKRDQRKPGTDCFWLLLPTYLVEVICPPLHHLATFWQILRMVVCRPDGISFAVGELTLDHVRRESVLV